MSDTKMIRPDRAERFSDNEFELVPALSKEQEEEYENRLRDRQKLARSRALEKKRADQERRANLLRNHTAIMTGIVRQPIAGPPNLDKLKGRETQ